MNSSQLSTNGSSSSNETAPACTTELPTFREYIMALPRHLVITYSVLGILTLVCIGVYIEELLYLYRQLLRRRHRHENVRNVKWLLAIYPVISVTAFVAIVVPSSSALNDLVSSVYVSICLYVFVEMLIGCYGDIHKMIDRLTGLNLHLNLPPLCCLCRCLPRLSFSSTWLQVLQSMALQFTIVSPFVGYIVAINWANTTAGQDQVPSTAVRSPENYINFIYAMSALMAIWSLTIMFQISYEPLKSFSIGPKFVCFQLVLLINGIQESIISILVLTGVITCQPPLNAGAEAARWNHMLLICEMLALSLTARAFYRIKHRIVERHSSKQTKSHQQDLPTSTSNIDQHQQPTQHHEDGDFTKVTTKFPDSQIPMMTSDKINYSWQTSQDDVFLNSSMPASAHITINCTADLEDILNAINNLKIKKV